MSAARRTSPRRAAAWALGCLLGLGPAGCSLSHTVSADAFADMAVDKKLRLFDAENDVSAAEDDLAQMHERDRLLRRELKAARRDASNMPSLQKLYGQRVAYLELARDYLGARAEAQGAAIDAARGKFELAKALLVKKYRLAGAEGLDPKAFERQSAELGRRAQAALAAVVRRRPALERARGAWRKLYDEAVARSVGGPFIPGEDDQPVEQMW